MSEILTNDPFWVVAGPTGGRGAMRQLYEGIQILQENGLRQGQDSDFAIAVDETQAPVLETFGKMPDIVIPTNKNRSPEEIKQAYLMSLGGVPMSGLWSFGARPAGLLVAQERGLPSATADGGIPDAIATGKDEVSPWAEAYAGVDLFAMNTQFPWQVPERETGLESKLLITDYPRSQATTDFVERLRGMSKEGLLGSYGEFLDTNIDPDSLVINVLMSNVLADSERQKYGGYLTEEEWLKCNAFVNMMPPNVANAAGNQRVTFVAEKGIAEAMQEALARYRMSNATVTTFGEPYNYQAYLALQAAADVNVSRAANCIPNLAWLRKPTIVTAVPDGPYMDEENAAEQFNRAGLAYELKWNDPDYGQKLIEFARDSQRQDAMIEELEDNYATYGTNQTTGRVMLEWLAKRVLPNDPRFADFRRPGALTKGII